MRIAHIIDSIDPAKGGPPSVVARLAAAQAATGHAVSVFAHDAPARRDDIAASLRGIPGFELVQLTLCAPGGFDEPVTTRAARGGLNHLLDSSDILHLHGVWCRIVATAARLAERRGLPYVVATHGSLHAWSLAQKPWKKRLALALGQRTMLEHAAFIHALNSQEAQDIRALARVRRVEVIPNGIFQQEIENLPPPGSFYKFRPVLQQRPYILFLGRLHRVKGLDYLAQAFRHVAARNLDVDLVVAGPDDGVRSEFIERLRVDGIEHRVHIVGPLYGKEKYAALVDARCLCLPSRVEGFSMVIVEALGCGVPVVISRHCHFPAVQDCSAGIVVELDAAAIAEALLQATSDSAWHARASLAARELVLSRFTWPAIAEQLVHCYEEVLWPSSGTGSTGYAAKVSR